MARILDADTSEIDRQHIERRVGRSLEDATQSADKGVGTIVVHGLQHQASRATSAKRLHEGCGERTDKLVVQTAGSDTPGNALHQHIHRSRGTKHGHSHKDRHQIGDDADCCMKSVLGALDESIIDIDLFECSHGYEGDDNTKQDHVGRHIRHERHRILVHLPKTPDDDSHKSDEST